MALTTHRRPMNFAQIYFSPTDFLNGKSMEARDSTSLKDNVSKCQLLGFRSSPPEFAMSAICTGLYGIKGKDSLAGAPPGSRNRLSFWLSFLLAPACLCREDVYVSSSSLPPREPRLMVRGCRSADLKATEQGPSLLASENFPEAWLLRCCVGGLGNPSYSR